MTDRHAGYIVVLERDLREDDAQATIAALQQIKGVLNVTPVVSDPELAIATIRAREEFLDRLYELARSFRGMGG